MGHSPHKFNNVSKCFSFGLPTHINILKPNSSETLDCAQMHTNEDWHFYGYNKKADCSYMTALSKFWFCFHTRKSSEDGKVQLVSFFRIAGQVSKCCEKAMYESNVWLPFERLITTKL